MKMFRSRTRILGGAVALSAALQAQTFTTLYTFGSPPYEGTVPSAGVVYGSQGELYGVTEHGGNWNYGTVYELLPPVVPGGARTEVVLHSFNGADGAAPLAGLLLASNGTLYGVTTQGGAGYGTAFELDPPAAGSTRWVYTVIYQFTDEEANPSGALAIRSGHGLYGVTGNSDVEHGTVYSLTPPSGASGAWTKTTLYSFPGGSSGWYPVGALAVGSNGTLFGVTEYGGRPFPSGTGSGTVFSLTPPAVAGGPWTEKLLYAFNPAIGDGIQPMAGLIIEPAGVLYGTTTRSGAAGWGTVFSLTPAKVPNEPMTEAVLYSFAGPGSESASSLVLGPNRILYGTTEVGGANGDGMVFELLPPGAVGGSWTEKTLHSFTGGTDGSNPNGLTAGPNGTLFGATANGGTYAEGTVFAVAP